MFFENKTKPVLTRKQFFRRLFINTLLAFAIIFISLTIGVGGYMLFAKLRFVDALLNASMILAGMGPVDPMINDSAKYFASVYALFSGITFLTTLAVILAPVVHRALYKFHIVTDEEEEQELFKKDKKNKM